MRKELEEKRNDLLNELETVIEKAKTETRAFTEEESTRAEEIKKEIKKIDETAKVEEEMRSLEVEKPKEEKRMEKTIVEKLMNGQTLHLEKEERAVTSGIATGGNVAVAAQTVGKTYADSILAKLEYISPLYGRLNKIVTSQPHQIPIQNTKLGKFVKTAELGTYVAQNADFTSKTLNAVKYTNMFVVSKELLQDSMYDIEAELVKQTVEALGITLDELFVKGDATEGVDGLLGVTTAAGAKEVVASTVKAVTADDIVELYYALPIQHRQKGVFMFSDATAKALAKLKDAEGKPLLYTSYNVGGVDNGTYLMGRPVIINNFLPDIAGATADKAILFADLERLLTVGIRKNFEMQRSTEFGFLNDSIAVKSSLRLDAKLIDQTACAYLKTKIA